MLFVKNGVIIMKRWISVLIIFLLAAGAVSAEKFRFLYREGEKYRVISEVDEKIFINDVYIQRVNILNKIAIEIAEKKGSSGYLSGLFQISEKEFNSANPYKLTDETKSEYWRDEFGYMDIEDKYYMPVVRNVPVFPAGDLQPGDSWTGEGEEVHDFSAWGIPEPFRFPTNINYKYLGKGELEGSEYDLISVQYNVFYKPARFYNMPDLYPVLISGYSDQVVYWDSKAGRPFAYKEEFDFIFEFADGSSYEALGTAQAIIIESSYMDKEKIADDIQAQIDNNGLKDTGVISDEQGVTITLSDIQFQPDSSVLLESEKEKLRRIADILKKYPDRDIRITGHTALAGTEEGRLNLSTERARAVGEFLLSLGVRDKSQMIINGVGATQPVADNNTEEGMKKNRRVEITILEN